MCYYRCSFKNYIVRLWIPYSLEFQNLFVSIIIIRKDPHEQTCKRDMSESKRPFIISTDNTADFPDEFIKENNIPMAVATTTHEDKAIACLKNAGLDSYFDYVITGDKVEHGKPDPEIFLKAVGHFGVPLKEALVFEDGHNGAQAAIKGGIPLIIVQDLAKLSEEDVDKAVMVIDDIRKAIPYLKEENERTAGIQAQA